MLSLAMSLVSTFVFNPMFLLGYAVAVLFPVPFLNSTIISLWSKFGSSIVATVKGFVAKETTAVTASATQAVETAVAGTVLTSLVAK